MLDRLSPAKWQRVGSMAYIVTGAATGASLLSKAPLVAKVSGLPIAVAAVALTLGCFVPVVGLLVLRWARWIAPVVLIGAVGVAVGVAPKVAAMHALGRGTDQGDCVSVAAERALSGQFPFDRAAMWSGNGMSCGLGWDVLHAPFTMTFGYPAAMVALLLASMAAVWVVAGREVAERLLVLFAAVPGFWQGFANGNDFVTFAAVSIALAVAATSASRTVRLWALVMSVPVSQFRLPFALLPAVLAGRGERRAGWGAVGVGALGWAAVVAWNPARALSDGPLHVLRKATGMAVTPGSITLAAAIMAAVVVVAYVLCARLSPVQALPVHMAILLVPQALPSLASRVATVPDLGEALARWEGASWLAGVALAAALLCAPPPEPTDEATSPTLAEAEAR